MYYVTSRKVAGSNSDEVIGFFQFIKSFQRNYGAGVDLACYRKEYQEFSLGGGGVLSARKADSTTAICDPIV
jgi:hypothetical protein